MEMEPLVWLDIEFLSAAIGDGQECVDILEYEVTPAVPEGSNYLGCLYRVKVNYKKECSKTVENISLIIKAPVAKSIIKEFADKLDTVTREAEIYNTVLPQMNRYLEEDTIAPKKYFSPRKDMLVLEDLTSKGYRMCDRIKQLDHDHCMSCMRAIAKFHASSVALHNVNPKLIETVGKEVLFAEDTGWYESQNGYIKNCFTSTANGLKTVKAYEKFGEMVFQQIDSMWEKLVKVFSKEKPFRVLNHGDVWTNNILFKHDECGRITDVKLVDFQMCRYTTLGTDIQYFLVACPNADVRLNGFSDLLDEYRKTFNVTLRKLNCNIQLSAEELENEVKSAEPFQLFVLCTLLPIALADPENPPRAVDDKTILESLDPKINTFLQIYYNPNFLDLVVEYLRRLEVSGYFN